MKQLNRLQSALFLTGGVLMVIGAACYCLMFWRQMACWTFLAGALLFASMQLTQTYGGTNITIRRLKNIQCIADIFFILSGILMVDSFYQWLRPLFHGENGTGYIIYIEYVYNKWVILLLVAALLEMYTTHRLGNELEKNKKYLKEGDDKLK